MTLKTDNKSKSKSSSKSNNKDSSKKNTAELNSKIEKINNLIFFEDIKNEKLMEEVKRSIRLVLGCIKNIREELARSSDAIDSDIKIGERLATARDYEKFYSDVLKDLEKE